MASGDKEDGPQKSPKKISELYTIMGTTYLKEKFELEKSAIMNHPIGSFIYTLQMNWTLVVT